MAAELPDLDLEGRRLLVTGGAGFVGSCLVRAALRAGAGRVVVLDALTYAAVPSSLDQPARDPRFALRVGDVCSALDCRRALEDARPDWVVHLAAESHVDRSIEDPNPFLRTNVTGTAVLLGAALDHLAARSPAAAESFRLLHSSTDEVFGDRSGRPAAGEGAAYAPSSPYSASKAAADHLVLAFHRTYGLPAIVTHSGNNYGPRQFPEKLVPLAALRALAGEDLPQYGDGLQIRDWLHVEDHCRGLLAVGLRGRIGERYCLSAGCLLANRAVLEAVRAAAGPAGEGSRIVAVADRPGHDRCYALDPARVELEVGWRATVAFTEGLPATVGWYRDHPEWVAEARQRSSYRGERLGLGRRRP